MKYLKYFEKETKYKEGDYVLVNFQSMPMHPVGSKNLWHETVGHIIEVDVVDQTKGSFRVGGDYKIRYYDTINKKFNTNYFTDYHVIRHLTEPEIIEYNLISDTNKYNL